MEIKRFSVLKWFKSVCMQCEFVFRLFFLLCLFVRSKRMIIDSKSHVEYFWIFYNEKWQQQRKVEKLKKFFCRKNRSINCEKLWFSCCLPLMWKYSHFEFKQNETRMHHGVSYHGQKDLKIFFYFSVLSFESFWKFN